MRTINLLREHLGEPALDTGLSHALALEVGMGRITETLRLHPADAIVAFGRQDVLSPGYGEAVAAARRLGFEAVERLAGGRAAVFHPGTLAFSWAIPTPEPRHGVHDRFRELAELVRDAFSALGARAEIGELAGEYCPGAYSVHVGHRKVMGVGQRLVRGAAHVGGVVVVHGGERIREVLEPVYAALGIAWDPATAGALTDAVPGLTLSDVAAALLDRFGERYRIVEGTLDPETVAHASRLAARHRSPAA